jgi:hypothetical protein
MGGGIVRSDVFINEVLAKCDVLKRAGLWPSEPLLRPRAWIQNFDPEDRPLAAFLLDKFTFYNKRFTDALLVASYFSIGDGMPKGPQAPHYNDLLRSLHSAAFTPVRGERPNPTDSGYLLCRKARQLLGVPEERILETADALSHAYSGNTVVFLDDFVGSGDQFLRTWANPINGRSFQKAKASSGFIAIYVTLVTTDFGLDKIHKNAPEVAVCATHTIETKSTVFGLTSSNLMLKADIEAFLSKYSSRLRPTEDYIAKNPDFLIYGYKTRGLMLGFEHSIPDATLPIFWSPGPSNWEPLIERK